MFDTGAITCKIKTNEASYGRQILVKCVRWRMADFIVSGQIPGTTFQITFAVWMNLVMVVLIATALRFVYRSMTVRGLIIAVRMSLVVRRQAIAE